MGGKVLELRSEKLIKQGRNITLYDLVSKGLLSIGDAAKEAGIPVSKFQKNMAVYGLKKPG